MVQLQVPTPQTAPLQHLAVPAGRGAGQPTLLDLPLGPPHLRADQLHPGPGHAHLPRPEVLPDLHDQLGHYHTDPAPGPGGGPGQSGVCPPNAKSESQKTVSQFERAHVMLDRTRGLWVIRVVVVVVVVVQRTVSQIGMNYVMTVDQHA